VNAEGWYQDPYGSHEARWISNGEPTKLVRDGARESYDAPPAGVAAGPLVPLETEEMADGGDLVRADDRTPKPDYRQALRNVWEQTSRRT
jgi:hypothetical protein